MHSQVHFRNIGADCPLMLAILGTPLERAQVEVPLLHCSYGMAFKWDHIIQWGPKVPRKHRSCLLKVNCVSEGAGFVHHVIELGMFGCQGEESIQVIPLFSDVDDIRKYVSGSISPAWPEASSGSNLDSLPFWVMSILPKMVCIIFQKYGSCVPARATSITCQASHSKHRARCQCSSFTWSLQIH